ncbi:HlyD family efflux transporter periplasmic adaptor subunit, partial [bacterium]|nr:HlyD family efflux transporter periplasmic adaptor subunit [bacterium]
SARERMEVVQNQEESNIDQAHLTLQFAKQDLQQYKEGEYPKLVMEAEAAITIAEEELSQAEENLKWSKILFEKKYLSETELQQDELATQKARLSLRMAKEDLKLLQNFTYKRQITQLESDVKQAKMALERTVRSASANITEASARAISREERFEEEKDDYKRVEEQVERAQIRAPIDGVALYASSVMEDWEDDEDRIRVGAEVDERREIIFLTAAEEYNVDIQVQETDLNKVEPGLPVSITVDALPEEDFKGVVHYVSPLPNQRQQYLNPNLKVYNTDIQIEGDGQALRNGMSCKAEIVVEEYENVVYVPIQAVVKVNDQSVVFIRKENQIEQRPVKIGMDNNRMIHIKEGVQEGEYVLLKPPLEGTAKEKNPQAKPTPSPSPAVQITNRASE